MKRRQRLNGSQRATLWPTVLFYVAVAAVIGGPCCSPAGAQQAPAGAATPAANSQSPAAAAERLPDAITVEAYLEPYRSIEISSVESGVIDEILVAEGERVSKGQELIRLDTAVLQSQLKVAEAQASGKGRVMAAQADYDQRKDKLAKLEALAARGKATNQAELDRERATARAAEGLLVAQQEEMEIFKLSAERIRAEIERRVLRSSIDGVVVEIVKDIAEQVSMLRSKPGEPDYLIRIVRLEELKMTAHLPYRIALQLQVGNRLPVLTEGPRGRGEVRVEGVVEFVSPIIQSSTATMAVRLRIDNADLRLRSGAAARVMVQFAK